MKILVVSPFLPSARSHHGGGRLLFDMIEHLGSRHRVGLIAFSPPPDSSEAQEELRRSCWFLRIIPQDIYHLKKRERLTTLFSRVPSWFLQTHSDLMRSCIQEEIQSREPDIVQIEFLGMAHYVEKVCHPRMVLNIHEAFGRTWFQRAMEHWRSPLFAYLLWDYGKLARREKELLSRFRAVLSFTDEDRRYLLRRDPGVPVYAWLPGIPAGPERKRCTPGSQKGRRVLFVGSFSHYPNVDGIRFFCKKILPRVRKREAEVRVDIVGANPPPAVKALEGDSIWVHGYVEDLDPYYERADVVIVPVRFGGGIRVKLLEALGRGLPVVATVVGAEGISGIDGEHLFVTRNAEEFAARVSELLGDSALRQRMGEKARELAETEYGWSKSIERLEGIYERLAGSRTAEAGRLADGNPAA